MGRRWWVVGVWWWGATSVVPRPVSGDSGAVALEMTTVHGHRSATRLEVGRGSGWRAGLSLVDTTTVAYASFEGRGLLRSLRFGNLTLQAGERLLLGRRFGSYPVAAERGVGDGLRVSPSLSRYYGRRGVAIALGHGNLELRCAALSSSREGPVKSPDVFWGGALWSRPHALAALAVGGSRRRLAVAMINGFFAFDTVAASAEIAHTMAGDVFVALRVGRRGAHDRFAALLYRAPSPPPALSQAMLPEAGDDVVQGARIDYSARWSWARASWSLVLGEHRSTDRADTFRRTMISLESHDPSIGRWEAAMILVEERSTVLPPTPLVTVTGSDVTRLLVRSGLYLQQRWARHTLRVDYAPPISGRTRSVLLTAGTTLSFGPLEVRWAAAGYSLTAGTPGFVARPTVGPFESFAAVYNRGSEVAIRARLYLGGGISLLAYYGSPWLGSGRAYIGARYDL